MIIPNIGWVLSYLGRLPDAGSLSEIWGKSSLAYGWGITRRRRAVELGWHITGNMGPVELETCPNRVAYAIGYGRGITGNMGAFG